MCTTATAHPSRPHAPPAHAAPALQALEAAEEKLDADIERLERLDEDDLERMRRDRLDQLKKVHKQKSDWIAQVRAAGGKCEVGLHAPASAGRRRAACVPLIATPPCVPTSSLRWAHLASRQPPTPHPQGHGEYRECHDQKQFFEEVKKEQRAVIHFYRPSTRRCEILDKHLAALAHKHIETKFMRVDAEKSPFIAERLKIWMLPTLVLVKDGKTEHSVVGFDELGGGDNFPTAALEQLLLKHDAVMESFV
jgi:hypothetical protein